MLSSYVLAEREFVVFRGLYLALDLVADNPMSDSPWGSFADMMTDADSAKLWSHGVGAC